MTRSMTSRPETTARDRWRTVRTITCELAALTGPSRPPGFGRPLAGPEMLVELPSFQGHMLRGAVLPAPRAVLPAPRTVEQPRTATIAQAEPTGLAWVAPLMLLAITGILLGSLVALASG